MCVMCAVHCCVSKHITISCVQPHNLSMHVAQVQLHLASVLLLLLHLPVTLSMFMKCCVVAVCCQS